MLIGSPEETIDDDGAWRFLTGAQVPDDVARRMVRHLHEGEAVMCVQLAHVDLRTAEALISDPTAGGGMTLLRYWRTRVLRSSG